MSIVAHPFFRQVQVVQSTQSLRQVPGVTAVSRSADIKIQTTSSTRQQRGSSLCVGTISLCVLTATGRKRKIATMRQAAATSWSSLSELVSKAVREGNFNLQEAGRRGSTSGEGPASAQALVRSFGEDPGKIRVKFYRDTHAWCPYCHKVWLQLEEKRIPYTVEKINMNCYGDKKPSFLMKTPRGLLPAIEIDGRFQTESSVIMQLIEDSFPDYKPLMPPRGTDARRQADRLLELERGLFGAWLGWLREVESPAMKSRFESAMDATDKALAQSSGPYFLGDDTSLVDCVFASTLERIAASILYYKGLKVKNARWSSVNRWFEAMETREAYRASQSDFHTHVHDLPPQIGGCIASGEPEQIRASAAIDGTDGKSWHLPLPPLAETLEGGVEVPVLDRLEAASAVIHCHEGIVRSACNGIRADSTCADKALSLVVQALVEGPEKVNLSIDDVAHFNRGNAGNALRWTRDRICVPRDMSYPAARQLRAHLNFVADQIDPRPDGTWRGSSIPDHSRRDMDPKLFHGSSFPGF